MERHEKNINWVVLLLALALASGITGCGQEENLTSDTSDGSQAITSETESEQLSDDVPALNFEGAEFKTIIQSSTVYDMYVAEATGDVLSDSIHKRNAKISERFNVKIAEPTSLSFGDLSNLVKQSVQAGDAEWDLILGQMEQSGKDTQSGIYMNWYDIPYVNFDKPWWPKSFKDVGTVNGKMYLAMSDLCVSFAEQTWAMVFDKAETQNRGITNVYDMVESGDWTLDQLNKLTKDVYIDANNNGKKDPEDYFGYTTEDAGCQLAAYFYGFNQKLAAVEDDKVVMKLNSEKAAQICDKLYSLFQNPGTLNISKESDKSLRLRFQFQKGRTMFSPIQLQHCYSVLRDYENDYGIIPFPKWDEKQEEYYSITDAGCNVLAVPVTAKNIEMTGAIVEALSAESYFSVMPVYCETALGIKGARDEESRKILQMVLDNRYIDFSYLYDGWEGWTFNLQPFVENEGVFASTYASKKDKVQSYYDSVFKFFYDEK